MSLFQNTRSSLSICSLYRIGDSLYVDGIIYLNRAGAGLYMINDKRNNKRNFEKVRDIMNNRIEQLDSIRGIAALSVLFNHMGLVSTTLPIFFMPLKLVNGHSAVIIFFILSGFVLSLPILNKNRVNYFSYIIKRIFRIYVPYLIAILFSILLSFVFFGGIPQLSSWFNNSWKHEPTIHLVIEHIMLIGNIHSNDFNNVIWSLIHEMRISIIFPFIVLLLSKLNWRFPLILCFVFSGTYEVVSRLHLELSNGFHTTYFDSLHYLSFFIIGMLLAQNRSKLISIYQKAPLFIRLGLIFIALLFYELPGHIFAHFHIFIYSLNDYGAAVGSSIFIVTSLAGRKVMKVLMLKPIRFLGKISYSLYLFHLPILFSLFYLFFGKLNSTLILVLFIPIAIGFSYLAWRFIEFPSMTIGKKLSNSLTGLQKYPVYDKSLGQILKVKKL